MTLAIDLLYIIIGAALVIWGADKLTDGAVGIAQRLRIPQIVIGLTVVAIGTSMPEFFVSFLSALKGTADMAAGNVIGSNIMNVLLIVGLSAVVAPIAIRRSTVRVDIPFAVIASLFLALFVADSSLSRLEGVLLVLGLCIFLSYTLRLAKKETVVADAAQPAANVWKSVGLVVLGLACLVGGSNVFVNGATSVAHTFGISEAVVGLTIVAGGTSLPELATSMVAAWKGRSEIAMGNVIGSNVFNILLILGVTGVISPLELKGITAVDLGVMLASVLLLWAFSYTKYTVARWEGALMVAGFAGYMAWLLTA